MYRVMAAVPVYEHGDTAGEVVAALRAAGLDCVLVDDGSGEACARSLATIAAADPGVHLLRLPENRGKGAAVAAGLRFAAERGCTHCLQIDADGQHALGDLPRLLAASRAAPAALVCGRPVFAADAPRARRYGRELTRFWTWVHTLSREIPDPMCGFRVYPLRAAMALLDARPLGRRMDFDIEILVRLHWDGVPMRWIDTAVAYPPGNRSGFRMGLDNWLITRVHTRLFFGMLGRLPRLLARRRSRSRARSNRAPDA